MSERIEKLFAELKNINRPAFISYITAGDPNYDECLNIVDHLVSADIDILELGIPFSDPLADGEANQLSAQRALLNDFSVDDVLSLVADIRKKHQNLPIVLYTYLNPVAFARDFKDFCMKAKKSGVDSLLLLDLIPEEGDSYKTIIDNSGLSLVALVAPNTPEERLNTITQFASSFVYYVSREGVTGERNDLASGIEEKISLIKKHTDLPVVMGFGISTPEHVKAAAKCGLDGIVVGSAIVRKIEALSKNKISILEIEKFVKSLTDDLK
jgi:tryptophan synthase alpha chain